MLIMAESSRSIRKSFVIVKYWVMTAWECNYYYYDHWKLKENVHHNGCTKFLYLKKLIKVWFWFINLVGY